MQLKLSSAKMAVILTRGRWVLKKRPYPDSKVNGANMGPTWVLSAPRGSHVGLMNLAICVYVPYLWGWCGLVLGRRCLNWPMWPASRRCHRRRLVVAVHISRLQSHTRLVSCLSRDHEGGGVICLISKYLVGYQWTDRDMSWWRHQMETFSALLAICAENSPVPGEFPAQRPVTRSFDVFFDLHLNKQLGKQWWGWWFETLAHPLWRHRNVLLILFGRT